MASKPSKHVAKLLEMFPQLDQSEAATYLSEAGNNLKVAADAVTESISHASKWNTSSRPNKPPNTKNGAAKPSDRSSNFVVSRADRERDPNEEERESKNARADRRREKEQHHAQDAQVVMLGSTVPGTSKVGNGISFADMIKRQKEAALPPLPPEPEPEPEPEAVPEAAPEQTLAAQEDPLAAAVEANQPEAVVEETVVPQVAPQKKRVRRQLKHPAVAPLPPPPSKPNLYVIPYDNVPSVQFPVSVEAASLGNVAFDGDAGMPPAPPVIHRQPQPPLNNVAAAVGGQGPWEQPQPQQSRFNMGWEPQQPQRQMWANTNWRPQSQQQHPPQQRPYQNRNQYQQQDNAPYQQPAPPRNENNFGGMRAPQAPQQSGANYW